MQNSPKDQFQERKRQVFRIKTFASWGALYFWIFLGVFLLIGFLVCTRQPVFLSMTKAANQTLIRGFIYFFIFLFSAVAAVIAQISYPRIHNLKVLLWGYATLLLHLFFLAIRIAERSNSVVQALAENAFSFSLSLYGMLGLVLMIVLFIPSFDRQADLLQNRSRFPCG